ncbi:TIGR03943 family putative permease subunit [Streptomyces ipomoeae]|uniref:TIGR03943 family putative permease subunit n=1 Tax=Streptomyces ipomoeae TaxID=103232 RepID=UPI001146676E|nr:TIGR03943 family protein [Streptomyces ipomoeae]MDX2936427.1 TIGR03943 family protein [Streptomyces ipomoeae]TQE24514.1 TIGR03943 family protein [Streptomyces ipomoeae]
MNRQAQTVVLFLTGGALLHAGSTDLYLRYVKSGLRPLLMGAGVVLIAAAVATLWYERRAARQADDTHAHPHADDAHPHHEPRVSWLLVLPLLALVLVAPPAAGSYTAMRTGTALQQQPWGYPTLPADGPLRLSVADYAGRAVYDKGRGLADRRLKVTGFLALDGAGKPYLVRMALNCCAADAQPVKIALSGRLPAVLQPDTWVEATGTYTPKRTKDPLNGNAVPYLDVTATRPVKAPQDPYDEAWNG